jgi:hypothetical protein
MVSALFTWVIVLNRKITKHCYRLVSAVVIVCVDLLCSVPTYKKGASCCACNHL